MNPIKNMITIVLGLGGAGGISCSVAMTFSVLKKNPYISYILSLYCKLCLFTKRTSCGLGLGQGFLLLVTRERVHYIPSGRRESLTSLARQTLYLTASVR